MINEWRGNTDRSLRVSILKLLPEALKRFITIILAKEIKTQKACKCIGGEKVLLSRTAAVASDLQD